MKVEIIKAEDYGLKAEKGVEVSAAFQPMITERDALESVYDTLLNEEINLDTCNKASELRKKLVKVRTGIALIHKTQKAFHLAAGKYVDAWKNKETLPVVQMEDKLRDIEQYYENIEKERIIKLQNERVELIGEYIEDAAERDLASMEDDVWESYLATKKQAHIDRIQAELDAEKERQSKIKAEKEEQERIRKENAKLKEEAKERERLAKIESEKRAKIEADRKSKEEEERKRREEKQRKERAEYEAKLKAEREAKEKIEREEKQKREKLEAELKAKEDAELELKAEKERQEQIEFNKGDAAKVRDLLTDLGELKTKYTFKSAKNKKMYKDVNTLIDKVVNHINN